MKPKNCIIELKHYVEILSFVYLSNRQYFLDEMKSRDNDTSEHLKIIIELVNNRHKIVHDRQYTDCSIDMLVTFWEKIITFLSTFNSIVRDNVKEKS